VLGDRSATLNASANSSTFARTIVMDRPGTWAARIVAVMPARTASGAAPFRTAANAGRGVLAGSMAGMQSVGIFSNAA
jgi:hypothetical protein